MKSDTPKYIRAWHLCKDNFFAVLVIALLDIGFFFMLGFASAPLVDRLYAASLNVTRGIGLLIEQGTSLTFIQMLLEPQILPYTKTIGLLMCGIALVAYITYVVIQGFAWSNALALVHKHKSGPFIKSFARVNLLWFVLFLVYFLAFTALDLRLTIIASLTRSAKPVAPFVVLYVFLLAVLYFAFLSYPSGSLRTAWRVGLSSWKQTMRMYAYVAIVLIGVQLVLTLLGWVHVYVMLAGSLILIPVITYLRVYFILSVKKHGIVQ